MQPSLHTRQQASTDSNQCNSNSHSASYDLPLHVGALFLVLAVSFTACAFALIVARIPRLRINKNVFFVFRHFGTGVLLATAFVHLLPTAFVSLTHPCLPRFWNELYPAMAGAIALAAVFFIAVVEMVFSPGRHACCGNVEALTGEEGKASGDGGSAQLSGDAALEESRGGPLFGRNISGRSQSTGRQFLRVTGQNGNVSDAVEKPCDLTQVVSSTRNQSQNGSVIEDEIADKDAAEQREKALMQCVMLEMGILFHSIFIGMALAVAVGSDQIVLLIAIVFHQMFEGLALGSRIAAIGWDSKALKPWAMALAFGCTTPLGQAIGIATRNLYDPGSQTGLLVVGIMNAISAGFLTFNSLIDLLSEDFLSDQSWRSLRGSRRQVAFSLVFFGAICMSLIGAWA